MRLETIELERAAAFALIEMQCFSNPSLARGLEIWNWDEKEDLLVCNKKS